MEMTRRHMFAAASAAAAMTFPHTALGGWEPSERYPDPAIKSLDPSFNRYRLFNASIERLATGMRWCEGPVYFGDARCLIWSDIPNNRLMRYNEVSGAVSVYREPSNHANGNRRDRQGRLVTCEHETRRVTRTEYDGTITVLMDKFEGKRLNSPNDVVVKSDGTIWFTDPTFGILGNTKAISQNLKSMPMFIVSTPRRGRRRSWRKGYSDQTDCASRPTNRSCTSWKAAAFPTARSSPSTCRMAGAPSATGAC